jgi:ribosomal-protein-alanine N-acetyltransferase
MLSAMIELTDGSILLRPWRLEEADWYAAQVRDGQIQQHTSEPADLNAGQVREAILSYADDPDHLGWVITAADSGDLLGNAALDLATGAVSYWVATPARGRGAATAAVRLMADYAFDGGALNEVRLWVRAGNRASARVAEKAGFIRAPDLDETIPVRGEPWTAHYYTRTRAAAPQ